MQNILTISELDALFRARLPPDMFGPQTHRPFLAVNLDDTPSSCPDFLDLNHWLANLPCPVIGVGIRQGTVSPACDIVLEAKAEKDLRLIARNIKNAPIASLVLIQHLRLQSRLSAQEALTCESLAYATLQNGPEFKHWLSTYTPQNAFPKEAPPLLCERKDSDLALTFNRPETRNAVDIEMRDSLCASLDLALIDTDIKRITLTGVGATFSTGGDLAEFGQVSDPATAHWIRSVRRPANSLAKLSDRLHVHVNGAAIGAGVEIAAFGTVISATPKAWFQLPELKYGLIPGAGGTVSLPRRIGRQRTGYMALTMKRINAQTALEWGLIDAIEG